MQVLPIQPVPAQTFNVILASQQCTITLRQRSTGLFIDLYVSDALIIGGVICQNLNVIVRDAHLGFIGDLAFFDTQGTADPVSTGLGSRYVLLYLSPSDLPPGLS
jgi:hypothetical protein